MIHCRGILAAIAVASGWLLSGCFRDTTLATLPDDGARVTASLPAPGLEIQQQLLQAKDALVSRLTQRLQQVMSAQGPVAAVAVCQKEALELTAEVARENRVTMGRVGVRTRNPRNLPPAWAAPLLRASPTAPQFVALDDGRAAAILPIVLQSQCVMCHGPARDFAPELANKLQSLYPNDQATGFREGDLRGWIWIATAEKVLAQ